MASAQRNLNTQLDLSDLDAIKTFSPAYVNDDHGMSIIVRTFPEEKWAVHVMTELGPNGPEPWTDDMQKPGIHVIHAGTPHRTPHRNGYWHIGEVDEVNMWYPPSGSQSAYHLTFERSRS